MSLFWEHITSDTELQFHWPCSLNKFMQRYWSTSVLLLISFKNASLLRKQWQAIGALELDHRKSTTWLLETQMFPLRQQALNTECTQAVLSKDDIRVYIKVKSQSYTDTAPALYLLAWNPEFHRKSLVFIAISIPLTPSPDLVCWTMAVSGGQVSPWATVSWVRCCQWCHLLMGTSLR